MANTTWRNFEQSPGVRKWKTRIRRWIGREPYLRIDVEVDLEHWGGWDFARQALKQGDVLYSLGVSDDIRFERKACEAGAQVFAFDPTPYCVEWIANQELPGDGMFQFRPWAAAGKDGTLTLYPRISSSGNPSEVMYTLQQEGDGTHEGVKVKSKTIASIADTLGHQTVDVLKMDIEGAEYEVLDAMLASRIRPRMLLIEFHHRFKSIGAEKTRSCVERLRRAGYRLAHASMNNREACFTLGVACSFVECDAA